MTGAYNWLLNLLPKLAQLWTWLNTSVFEIGTLKVAPIGLISTSMLVVLLGISIIRG